MRKAKTIPAARIEDELLRASFGELAAYKELARTPKGWEAISTVAVIATGVVNNVASQADLDDAVELCAEISGIPASALASHAKGVIDAYLTHQAAKQRSTH